jgi:hypothetical protein
MLTISWAAMESIWVIREDNDWNLRVQEILIRENDFEG